MDIGIEKIPNLVAELKAVMGISLVPSSDHCLFEHFIEYEKYANITLEGWRDLPTKVLELANFGFYVIACKSQWDRPKVREYVRNKLIIPDAASVMGILFEFRAAVHFMHVHPHVEWKSNIGNKRELDIIIQTKSGKEVLVECTHKMPRSDRQHDYWRVKLDLLNSIETKADQARGAKLPVFLAIYIPEELHWHELVAQSSIDKFLADILSMSCDYASITEIGIVSYRKPTVRVIGQEQPPDNDDYPVFFLGNKIASYQLPCDFRYGLDIKPVSSRE